MKLSSTLILSCTALVTACDGDTESIAPQSPYEVALDEETAPEPSDEEAGDEPTDEDVDISVIMEREAAANGTLPAGPNPDARGTAEPEIVGYIVADTAPIPAEAIPAFPDGFDRQAMLRVIDDPAVPDDGAIAGGPHDPLLELGPTTPEMMDALINVLFTHAGVSGFGYELLIENIGARGGAVAMDALELVADHSIALADRQARPGVQRTEVQRASKGSAVFASAVRGAYGVAVATPELREGAIALIRSGLNHRFNDVRQESELQLARLD